MQAGKLNKLQETRGAKEEVKAAEEISIVRKEEEGMTVAITKVAQTEAVQEEMTGAEAQVKVAVRKREDNINSVGLAVQI
jgi:predicted RNA-binding protein with PUA domain